MNGKQFFRQYDVFNQFSFLKYLKELHGKFRKLLLLIDRAAQHHTSVIIRKYLKKIKMLSKLNTYLKVLLIIMPLKNVGDKERTIC